MAIVLPQGRLNNTNDEYIRKFIMERARILAVVGLHGNTFKPHTGTKTKCSFFAKNILKKNSKRLVLSKANMKDYGRSF